jgi:hypothetical protein
MHARVASALLTLVIGATQTAMAAEDRSVASPEAVQAIIDKAMPDFVKGNASDVLRQIASDDHVNELAQKLQSEFKPLQAKLGRAVDWMYVGVRSRGNMFRQYVYVCRYDYAMIVWRITAAEERGVWRLAGAHFDANYQAILAQAVAGAPSDDADNVQRVDKIADAVTHGRGNAIDMLKANLLVADSDNNPDQLRRSVEQVMTLIVLGGGVVKCEFVGSKTVAGVLAERSYLVRCERSLLKFDFLSYRPNKDWKLLGFNYHLVGSEDEVFGSAPLEPKPLAASHQTARSAKENAKR